MLETGAAITTTTGDSYALGKELSSGGQARIFSVQGHALVAKLYHAHVLREGRDTLQRKHLERMIQVGPTSSVLVWPQAVVERPALGYVMERVPSRFVSLRTLNWRDVVKAGLRARLLVCYRLVDALAKIHMRGGYAYCDISSENVLCDPASGQIWLIDNDNLTIDGKASPLAVRGTPGYMAPELWSGQVREPSIESDLHSLAVLLFETLLFHHPLRGDRVLTGPPEMEKEALGRGAKYVYDPNDRSNAYTMHKKFSGVPPSVLPEGLQRLFEEVFTKGLKNPKLRVRETRWRRLLIGARDELVKCPNRTCPLRYTFYRESDRPLSCVWCGRQIRGATVLRLTPYSPSGTTRRKVLHDGDWLAAHHCKFGEEFNFERQGACGRIELQKGRGLTLRNVSSETFVYYRPGEAEPSSFPPEKRLLLAPGYRIEFGANGLVGEVSVET